MSLESEILSDLRQLLDEHGVGGGWLRMTRPLRYEAAGAVYNVMARGDGGKNVFEDDKDCFAWTA